MEPHNRKKLSKKDDDAAWKKWNQEAAFIRLTPEQTLEWLDSIRAFMFEVWKQNPQLRKQFEHLREQGF